MEVLIQIEARDRALLAGIDAVMLEAAQRSGEWLVCRPGCTDCCMGPFAITQLDAIRLRTGLAELERQDSERAARVRSRAHAYVSIIAPDYPGDTTTGELRDEDCLPEAMDSIPCPVLDPDTGRCDLYTSRPITCRAFGPATRISEETVGACELCYVGASEADLARCAVEVDADGLEPELIGALENEGIFGITIVAYALTMR